MSEIYSNFVAGIVDDNPLLIGATTLTSTGLITLPAVAAPDFMWIVLDPDAVAGAPEIVQVTAHTASASTATIARAQQSTTARQHLQNTVWRTGLTKADADKLPHRILTTTGDIMYASAANVAARLAGAVGVLHGAVGAAPSYSQVVAADIASDAIETAKILDSNVTTAKIADDAVTPAKRAEKLCQVRMSTPQSVANGVLASLLFNTEDLDTDGWHSTSVNTDRIIPNIAGWYRVTLSAHYFPEPDQDYLRCSTLILKNDIATVPPRQVEASSGPIGAHVASAPLIQMNGTTDYLSLSAFQQNADNDSRTVDACFLVELAHQA